MVHLISYMLIYILFECMWYYMIYEYTVCIDSGCMMY